MLFAALTLWLLIIIFAAWGAHALLTSLAKPKVVNAILLPGTLIATLAHVFGLLITGNEIRSTVLMSDDEQGDPKSEGPTQAKFSPTSILVGLLPIVACTASIYTAKEYLGEKLFDRATRLEVPERVPTTLDGFWDHLHKLLDVQEQLLDAVIAGGFANWQTMLFLYLAACLTIRMAPFRGQRRGAILAVLISGGLFWLANLAFPQFEAVIERSWEVLSFTVAASLLLLAIAGVAAGLKGVFNLVRSDG